jgi:hypothetical protein
MQVIEGYSLSRGCRERETNQVTESMSEQVTLTDWERDKSGHGKRLNEQVALTSLNCKLVNA